MERQIMKKTNILTLLAVGLIIIGVFVFFLLQSTRNDEKHQQITTFLNTNPPSVVTLRSLLGDVNSSPGDGAEIVVTVSANTDDFIDHQEEIDDIMIVIGDLLGQFFDTNDRYFVDIASSMREDLNFENLTLNVTFDFGHFEITHHFDAR